MKKEPCFIKTGGGFHETERGFSLVEVLLAISLLLMITVGIVSVVAYAQDVRSSAQDRPYAVGLAGEAIEVARSLREVVISEVPDGTYVIERSGTGWSLVEGVEIIADTYTREITVTTVDSAVKQIEAIVSWRSQYGVEHSVVLSTLLSDWSAASGRKWQFPVLESVLDFPGKENGIGIVAEGTDVFVAKDRGTGNLLSVDVSDISAPAVIGTADVAGSPQALAFSSGYIYVASTEKDSEFQVFSVLSPGTPLLVDSHDPSGNQGGLSVTLDGNMAYLGRESGKEQELWVYDISDPENILVEGILDLEGSIEDSLISGNVLVVVSDDKNQEVKLIDVSDPSLPVLSGGYDFTGNNVALSCTLYKGKIIVGMDSGDVYLLDISGQGAISEIGSYDAGSAIRDTAVEEGEEVIFLATDENAAELQIVDVSIPAQPAQIGIYNAPASINSLWYDPIRDYLYAVGDANDEELMIFSPE